MTPANAPPLTAETLLRAYSVGIFPMADSRDAPDLFWLDPKHRGILPLDRFHISRSLARSLRRANYRITINRDFAGVVTACADREDTWINATIFDLYQQLHRAGFAHSIEVWDAPQTTDAPDRTTADSPSPDTQNSPPPSRSSPSHSHAPRTSISAPSSAQNRPESGPHTAPESQNPAQDRPRAAASNTAETISNVGPAAQSNRPDQQPKGALIGGVYGVTLGTAFFGESMFSRRTDASKIALAYLTHRLRAAGFTLFDTQFVTDHLRSLGAQEIPRDKYHQMLNEALTGRANFTDPPAQPTVQEILQRSTQTS